MFSISYDFFSSLLIKEHVYSKDAVEKLRNARERLGTEKEALAEIRKYIETLLKWYPNILRRKTSTSSSQPWNI